MQCNFLQTETCSVTFYRQEYAVELLTDRNMHCNFLQTGTCSVTFYRQEYAVELLTDRNMHCNFLQTGTCSVTDKEYVQEPDLVAALNCGFIFYKELNQP
jgi:hypothetical protein